MKKILIIHAHPEPQSFCSSLKKEAMAYFEEAGAEVRVRDLYALPFDPVGGRHDFMSMAQADYFKYQQEQLHAFQHQTFTPALQLEMDHLAWCDTLIFSFPLWWFGLPAILKGWVDRVFAMGFVYGGGKGVYEQGIYSSKKALLTITTGGPAMAYGPGGKNGDLDTILYPIHHGMLYFCGMQVLPPFICFSPARLTEDERKMELLRYREYLSTCEEASPLFG